MANFIRKRILGAWALRMFFLILACAFLFSCSHKFNNPLEQGPGPGSNHAPNPPSNPQPAENAANQDTTLTLEWNGSDPDSGDILSYDVYFGTANPPASKAAANLTVSRLARNGLSLSTTYFWKVVARDSHGAETTGPVWSFTTGSIPNHPPYMPANPSPPNGAANQPLSLTLGWSGGDPDPGDTAKYDVYFDTVNPPQNLVASSQPDTFLPRSGLSGGTTYFWQILSRDRHGRTTPGPVWSFGTGAVPEAPHLVSPANGATRVPVNPTVFVWNPVTLLRAPVIPTILPAPVPTGFSSAGLVVLAASGKAGLPRAPKVAPRPGRLSFLRSKARSSGIPALVYHIQVAIDTGFVNRVVDQSGIADTTYATNALSLASSYYWRVQAIGDYGPGPWSGAYSFLTDRPPKTPDHPTPPDGATNEPLSLSLFWSGGDPDPGDTARYDVYFDTVNPPLIRISTGQLDTTLARSGLSPGVTYYWKIVATDTHGAETAGPVWRFTTTFPPWFSQTSGTTHALWSVHFPVDAQTGYAVGDNGTILKTTDGGGTWASQTSGTTSFLTSVRFPADALTGYAVGDLGTILKTSNGGGTWLSQPSGTSAYLFSVHFPGDALTGFAAGANGTILKTTDGGATWASQNSGTTNWLESIVFPRDAQTGYAAGLSGTILKTTDGGTSWTSQNSGTTNILYSIQFPADALTGFTVGYNGTVLKTTDGGATWASQNSGTTNILRSIQFPVVIQTGYAVGGSGTILKTTDGGGTWAGQTSGTTNILYSVHFPVDNQTGYAVGGNGTILKTVTGGN